MKTFDDYRKALEADPHGQSTRRLYGEDDRAALAAAWIYCAFSEYFSELEDGAPHIEAVQAAMDAMEASACYPYERCGRENKALAKQTASAILRRDYPVLEALPTLERGRLIATFVGEQSPKQSQRASNLLRKELEK